LSFQKAEDDGDTKMNVDRAAADPIHERQGLATIADACEFLAVSRAHLYGLMNNGTVKYLKLGRCRRIRWPDLMALVNAEQA
jgi:excisionase family DNA binding protein